MVKSNASATRSRYVTSTVSGERVHAFVPAPRRRALEHLTLHRFRPSWLKPTRRLDAWMV